MNRLALLCLPALALLACKPPQEAPTAPGVPAPPANLKPIAAAPVRPGPAEPAPSATAVPKGHSCADDTAAAANAEDRVTHLKDEKTGAVVQAVGARLAGVAGASVAELSQMPEGWAGKTVRLEGNVSAMCTHRRAWFALQSDDKDGGVVRVVTAPTFLVPEGAIGKRARVEGMVELVDVDPATAQHYAQEHQLPAQTKAAVLRATGAEFL